MEAFRSPPISKSGLRKCHKPPNVPASAEAKSCSFMTPVKQDGKQEKSVPFPKLECSSESKAVKASKRFGQSGTDEDNERVAQLKQEVAQVLDGMGNLVWWMPNDSKKSTWSKLLGDVRSAVSKLESELENTKKESFATRAALMATLKELDEFKGKAVKFQSQCVAPWVPNCERSNCKGCDASFGWIFGRQHHCRACGEVFCGSCSSNNVPVPRWGYSSPVRVCNECYKTSKTNRLIAPSATAQAAPLPSVAGARVNLLQDIASGKNKLSSSALLKSISNKKAGSSSSHAAVLKRTHSARAAQGGNSALSGAPVKESPVLLISELRSQMQKRRSQLASPDVAVVRKRHDQEASSTASNAAA